MGGSRATTTRDRGVKLRKYAAAGVPWYWLVDPRGPSATVLRLAGGHHEVFAEHAGGEQIEAVEPFPLTLRLADWL